jgi:hypothetical protein
LLKEIEAWAIENVYINDTFSNHTNDAAIGLYQSYGFIPEGDLAELRAGAGLFAQPMIMEWRYTA